MNRIKFLAIALLAVVTAPAARAGVTTVDGGRLEKLAASVPHRGPLYAQKHGLMTATVPVHKSQSKVHARGGSSGPVGTTFLTGTTLTTGADIFYGGVSGDYNGDGKRDLATVVSSNFGASYSLSVVLSQGSGAFAAPVLTSITFALTDRVYSGKLKITDLSDSIVIVHSGSVDVYVSNGDGTFAAPVNTADGIGNPVGGLLTDINTDGNIDLIVTDGITQPSLASPMVATLLGNGNGTFQAATLVAFPGQALSVAFADLNNDGFLDIVSTSEVFFANGGGGYLSGTALVSSNGQPNSCAGNVGAIVVADLHADGDAFPDIATADCENNTVTVYINNADNTFQNGASYFAGHYPEGISTGDVDGDLSLDIISANSDSGDVTVLLANGDGTFQAATSGFSAGGNAWGAPAVDDFDGDGKMDVAVANDVLDLSFSLMFLHGAGDGSFTAARDFYAPPPAAGESDDAVGIASADFNGDGRADFVVGNAASTNAGVTVFITNTDGTLQAGVNYGSSGDLNSVATGDFNNDGKQDIVASDASSGSVELLLGNGDGTFQSAQVFPALSGQAGRLIVGDFNHDGKQDVAVTGLHASVAVLLNNGSGGFNSPVTYPVTGGGLEMAAGDLNSDGNMDLVVPDQSGSTISILMGNSDGTFTGVADADLGLSFLGDVAVGDLDGDGKQDVAATVVSFSGSSGIAVALGNNDGTFQTAVLYSASSRTGGLGPFPAGVQIADLDQDGNLDLVYTNSFYGTVGVLFGSGSGVFGSPVEFPSAGSTSQLITADVNGDGALDAVAVDHTSPGVVVLLNTAGSSTTVLSLSNPASVGDTVTFTSTVTAPRGYSAIPSGTVSFMEGSTVLGTGTLSSGVAGFSTAGLAEGSHLITANYSGDSTFLPSVSAVYTQVIVSGSSQPDYSLSSDHNSATIQTGQSATFVVTVTPINGYNGTVNFACGGVPAGVTCQFNPSSVTPNGGPAQLTLTVTAGSALASATPQNRPGRQLPLGASGMTGIFGLVLFQSLSGRRRRAAMAAILVVLLLATLSLVGCGGSSADQIPAGHNDASNIVHILATGSGGSGNTMHELDVHVTVQ